MHIKVEVERRVKDLINVEIPYYYKIDYKPDKGEYAVYGKIEATRRVEVSVSTDATETTYEFRAESGTPHQHTGYYAPEHKSTEQEFRKAYLDSLVVLDMSKPF